MIPPIVLRHGLSCFLRGLDCCRPKEEAPPKRKAKIARRAKDSQPIRLKGSKYVRKTLLPLVGFFIVAASLGVTDSAPTPKFIAKASTLTPTAYTQPFSALVETATIYAPSQNANSSNSPLYVGNTGDLAGALGYAIFNGMQCTQMPGLHWQNGNAIEWQVTHYQPSIGDTALFTFNHVGLVVGVWSNGDLEIAHWNWRGDQHRFSRSEFRGFR